MNTTTNFLSLANMCAITSQSSNSPPDTGSSLDIAVSASGLVIEVHEGASNGGTIWYRLAQFSTTPQFEMTSYLQWSAAVQFTYDIPVHLPSVACNNDNVVMTFQDGDENLYVVVGTLPANSQGTIVWGTPTSYTTGENSSVAINTDNVMLECHMSNVGNDFWYSVGTIDAPFTGSASIPIPQATFAAIALNDLNVVLLVYITPTGFGGSWVNLLAGTLGINGMEFNSDAGPQFSVGTPSTPGVALDNFGNYVVCVADSGFSTTIRMAGTITMAASSPPIVNPPWTYQNMSGVQAGPVSVAMAPVSVASWDTLINNVVVGCLQDNSQLWCMVGEMFSGDYSHWMTDSIGAIGKYPLTMLALPGTHDSGTFPITSESGLSPDNPIGAWAGGDTKLYASWAQAQDLAFIDQLNAGVRYFDLRVAGPNELAGNTYTFCHGMYGAILDSIINDLNGFFSQNNCASANEIVILDMNHLIVEVAGGGEWVSPVSWPPGSTPVCWMPGGANSQAHALAEYVIKNFNYSAESQIKFPNNTMLLPTFTMNTRTNQLDCVQQMSLNDIITSTAGAAGGRVIVLFDDAYEVQQAATATPCYLWANVDCGTSMLNIVDSQTGSYGGPSSTIQSTWPNVADLGDMISAYSGPGILSAWNKNAQNCASGAGTQFIVGQTIFSVQDNGMQNQLTFMVDNISLQAWETQLCSAFLYWLQAQTLATNPNYFGIMNANIIMVDWLEQTKVTPLCIYLNSLKS